MKKVIGALIAISLFASVPAHAQFGGLGGLLGGDKKPNPNAAKVPDLDSVMGSGAKIIVFTTIATDLAVVSANQMLEAFPPEKVEAIKATFLKYDELKKKRGSDGQLDANAETLASDGFKAMENLQVADYQKGKSQVVRSAYLKLGLALGADAIAASQVPPFLKSGKETVSSLSSNPMQMTKLGKLQAVLTTVTVLGQNVPSQIQSITTVRSLAKKIADAEGIKLGEPMAITSLDPAVLTADIKTVETEG